MEITQQRVLCNSCQPCPTAGETACINNSLFNCTSFNGVLVWGLASTEGVRERDESFCRESGATCGQLIRTDACGTDRPIDCGDCLMPETCGGGGTANQCGCTGESDMQLCAREDAECGDLSSVTDRCNVSRTVDCGTCHELQTCGEQAGPNACGGGITQISAGGFHTCALLSNGRVRCWGRGTEGQLGYGNVNRIDPPGGDVDIFGEVQQITAGRSHTCALRTNGTVVCWGLGLYGQLGYGDTSSIGDDETPGIREVPVGGAVRQISAGSLHTCAVLSTGSVRCWGRGADGRLGYGTTNNVFNPAVAGDVDLGPDVQVERVSAGDRHTCALLSNDSVRCWGLGTNGRLGYGNTENVLTPGAQGDINEGWTATEIAAAGPRTGSQEAGGRHTCALLSTNEVRCWGLGQGGRLGYGDETDIGDDETPNSVGPVGLGDSFAVVQIAAAELHNCALLSNGKVRCWGRGDHGQLGYGNTEDIGDNETPAAAGDVQVVDPLTETSRVTQITAGGRHSCALLSTGQVRCWGRGSEGQLGYGNAENIGDDESPASAGDIKVF